MTTDSARTAFYSGTFDPPTVGHLDIIQRVLSLFERLVIGIGLHHGKSPMFQAEERAAMLRDALAETPGADRATIVLFDGLVVHAARSYGASIIVRGVRDATDFSYEMQMAGMNGTLESGVSTIFLPAAPAHTHIAATFVRQIAAMGGDVTPFVPPAVKARLSAKFPPA